MEDRDKILSRIQKLYALAGNNPSQAEAESAMLKAQEMLLENNLTMIEVETFGSVKAINNATSAVPADELWEGFLASIIAGNFRCYAVIDHRHYLKFVGMARDADIAVATFKFARVAAKNLFEEFWRQWVAKTECSPKAGRSKAKQDYMTGFVQGITAKFDTQVKSKALMLVKDNSLVEWHDKQGFKQSTADWSGTAYSEAGQRGYADGFTYEKGVTK